MRCLNGENCDYLPPFRYGVTQLDDFPLTPVDLLAHTEDAFDLQQEKLRWETAFQEALASLQRALRRLDDEPCLTYSYDDMQRSWHGRDGQPMPLWTAGVSSSTAAAAQQQQEEMAVDAHAEFLYARELMDESRLPPVHVKKEQQLLLQQQQQQHPIQVQQPLSSQMIALSGIKRTASEAGLVGAGATTVDGLPLLPPGAGAGPLGYDIKPKLQRRDLHQEPASASVAPR